MNPESPTNASWGFTTPDGHFMPMPSLKLAGFEYLSKTVAELQDLIAEYIIAEEYEKCALIRDEIAKRV
ncbi:hypothetical protein [Mucilaginibacter agri]|uniref:Uncharacterized protein n=1 Tax=Mucilaginibacter agri TaxID=2695265 RepID=A0A965ZIW9_9SPHI|nr:hypothetical protein [Mucilaginibacter agri]NCD70799.1 hypothetical protein [Mucilaginibacter agri]